MKVLDNNILNSNITVQKMSTTLVARTPEEVEKLSLKKSSISILSQKPFLKGTPYGMSPLTYL